VKTLGKPLPERVMEAFGIICRQATGNRLAGFASTMNIRSCRSNETESQQIISGVESGKECLQALYGEEHYVLAHKPLGKDEVNIFDSLGGVGISKLAMLQLFVLFGSKSGEVKVSFPRTQAQTGGSNQCGVMVCASMADLALDLDCSDRFTDESRQREWMFEVLRTGVLSPCPNEREHGGDFPPPLWTNIRPELLVTKRMPEMFRKELPNVAHRLRSSRRQTLGTNSVPMEVKSDEEDERNEESEDDENEEDEEDEEDEGNEESEEDESEENEEDVKSDESAEEDDSSSSPPSPSTQSSSDDEFVLK